MPENTENHDLITTAQDAVDPTLVAPGIYLTRDNNGHTHTHDLTALLEQQQPWPDRKTGHHNVSDVDSLTWYLTKHGLPETELWGNADNGTIRAVINAHNGADDVVDTADGNGAAGWGDHIITLRARTTPDWDDWTRNDGKLIPQAQFAEWIEDHLPNFRDPSAADMLELAQTFQATTKVDFASSHRIKTGETQLAYTEHQTTTAGKKGQLAIPDTFDLALQVYENGPAYKVPARFRYRITDGTLTLGYRLTRPRDILLAAFTDIRDDVQTKTSRTVLLT